MTMGNAILAKNSVNESLKLKNNIRRKRGYSLVEIAAGLAVVAILILGALALVSVVNQSRLFTQASNELNVVQQAVRSLYSGQSNFTNVSSSILITTKAVPAKMVSGTTLRHAFSGQIDIAAASAAGGTGSGFQVTFRQIPADVCVKMLTADLGRGLYSAGVSSQVGQDGLPFTPAAAAGQCSGNYNDIGWIFY
jgi:type II secretory pathway pseudopilin PulG